MEKMDFTWAVSELDEKEREKDEMRDKTWEWQKAKSSWEMEVKRWKPGLDESEQKDERGGNPPHNEHATPSSENITMAKIF